MATVHEGDVGVDITLQAIEDGAIVNITGATDRFIYARTPSGTVKTWAATIVSGANGTLRFRTLLASDLDEEGTWTLQGKFTLGSNPAWTGYTEKVSLLVKSALA